MELNEVHPRRLGQKHESKMQELGLKYRYGFVEYYNKEEINRNVSIFEKPLDFEYQKEYRFYVERECDTPLKFSIGSLKILQKFINQRELLIL